MRIGVMKPWLFLLPALLIYLTVIFIPSLYTLYLSFFSWNGVGPHKDFVGLQNYAELILKDSVFPRAIKNNLQWMIGSLVLTTGLGLGLALLLNKKDQRTHLVPRDLLFSVRLVRRRRGYRMGLDVQSDAGLY
ncbi:hypothetical protein LJK88_16850 [Paenibacillus sp. P26]|nr:hypothetical protein LJK88_16850 [Paenibacillus sp. P26]